MSAILSGRLGRGTGVTVDVSVHARTQAVDPSRQGVDPAGQTGMIAVDPGPEISIDSVDTCAEIGSNLVDTRGEPEERDEEDPHGCPQQADRRPRDGFHLDNASTPHRHGR